MSLLLNSIKISSIIRRKYINYFVAAERSNFVKCARKLEKLKSENFIPNDLYKNGKFMVSTNFGEQVLVNIADNASKIHWEQYSGLPSQTLEDVKQNSVILNIIMDQSDIEELVLFAINIPLDKQDSITPTQLTSFVSLRQSLFLLPESESSYVLQARGLFHFGTSMKFCNDCGGKLMTRAAGTQKACIQCDKAYYPNISPVGITLIEDTKHEKVLLVRQARHPKGMYSCVAGFIEAGESLEHNIKREIAEEVGLEVSNVQYCSSQHWSMGTSQLMLGCIATATTEDYEADKNEIQDAKWVTAEELKDAVIQAQTTGKSINNLWVPPRGAIAHQIMKHWLAAYHGFIDQKGQMSKV